MIKSVVKNDIYERLRILYSVSKLLSTFESIDKTFPKIISKVAEVFPLITVVIIEHWEIIPKTAAWYAKDATSEQIDRAQFMAFNSYAYLTDTGHQEITDINLDINPKDNFISLPLIIDNLPAMGIIQLEGSHPLTEEDLNFVSSLTDLIGVALDRFYKTKKERELQLTRVEGLESEKASREGFVSLLTHDLRTPLTVAMICAENIIKRKGEASVSMSFAERIYRNLKRADSMIRDLLDANRIMSGVKLQLNVETFDIYKLVEETVYELSSLHPDRFKLSAKTQIIGPWDLNGVRRIVENLCTNAVKYGDENSPILINLSETPEMICISVINRGHPIPQEEQATLFDQFSRTKDVQAGTIQGWGIGLALVRGVAVAHGGSVSVKSDDENGTNFSVFLPKTKS